MKPCHCGKPGFSKGLCRYHYGIAHPLKRSPLKPSSKKIKPVSKQRAKALREYEKEKKEFFKEVTVCQFPGCESHQLTLHHKGGRLGKALTDRSNFAALCFEHHRLIEENPLLAKQLNLSVSRLSKAS